MIIFIDDLSEDDREIMKVKTLEHLPRIGETISLENIMGKVTDIIHEYTDGEDIYIYIEEVKE